VIERDIHQVSSEEILRAAKLEPGQADALIGGPPCQPFSIGGKHKGPTDRRNMWPEAIRAVRTKASRRKV